MKRSVNLNGFKPHHRRISAQDLIATYRALGMSDEEILAKMKKLSAAKPAQQHVAAEADSGDSMGAGLNSVEDNHTPG